MLLLGFDTFDVEKQIDTVCQNALIMSGGSLSVFFEQLFVHAKEEENFSAKEHLDQGKCNKLLLGTHEVFH